MIQVFMKDLYQIHKLEAITDQETEKTCFLGHDSKNCKNFKSRLIENNLSKGLCHVYAKENIEIFSDANKELFIYISGFKLIIKHGTIYYKLYFRK